MDLPPWQHGTVPRVADPTAYINSGMATPPLGMERMRHAAEAAPSDLRSKINSGMATPPLGMERMRHAAEAAPSDLRSKTHGMRKFQMAGRVAGKMAASGLRQMRQADEVDDEPDWDNFVPED